MLDVDIIKRHCRIELDESDEDSLLETYANAAQRLIENKTGRHIYATSNEVNAADDERALLLDDDLSTAMLLMIGSWYANREAVIVGSISSELPMAVQALIEPYQFYNM